MVDIIFFKNQEEFNIWLEENSEASQLWVGYYKKSTGRQSLTWSNSVDVALRFGWIDGIRKTIDDQRYKIRFTPRKKTSLWSAVNVKKVKEQMLLGNMKPAGMYLFDSRTDIEGYSSEQRNIPLAKQYEDILKENTLAWQFFTNLAPSYKRDSIWWVMTAKKEETRTKRLYILIESSEAGLKIPTLRKKL